MGAVLSFFRPAPVARGDWSQQELAEFYRVEAALTQAGLRVTSDRGLSDEQEPWFVFCRFDEEVILHFARIDGLYVVASEAFERPLQGPDFRALLNAVAAEHPTLVPVPRAGANPGGAQGRSGNLVLHPAALLAAIVATVAFQLAGGDAMAGELAGGASSPATHGSTGPMDAGSTLGGLSELDRHVRADEATTAGLASDDEGRYARHALILSAIALISSSLPTDFEVAQEILTLNEGQTGSNHGRAAPAQAPDAGGAPTGERERVPLQTAAMTSAADASQTHSASGSTAPLQSGLIRPLLNHAPMNADGVDLAILNILDLGAVGGQELAAMRAAESSSMLTGFLAIRGAAHTIAVAAAGDKTPAQSASAGGPAASTSNAAISSGGSSSAAGNTAAGQNVSPAHETDSSGSTASHAATGGGLAAPSVGSQNASAATSTALAQATTVAAVALGLGDKASTSATAQLIPAISVAAMTNAVVRSALNTFIEQHSGYEDSGSSIYPTELESTFKAKLADLPSTVLTKAIGSGSTFDFISGLLHSGPGSNMTKVGQVGEITGQVVGAAKLNAFKDTIYAPQNSGDLTHGSIGSIALGSADAKGGAALSNAANALDQTLASVGLKDPLNGAALASAKDVATSIPTVSLSNVDASNTDALSGPSRIASKDAGSGATNAHSEDRSNVKITPIGASDDASKDMAAIATKPHSEASAGVTDVSANAASTPSKDAGPVATSAPADAGAHQSLAGSTNTVSKEVATAVTTSTHVDTSATSSFKDTAFLADAALHSNGAILDTATLKMPAVLEAPKVLDEQGRQLIARFLDTTTQVQTFVHDHSFVMMDMDASHYLDPNFSIRTWSVGHNVEISIIGIAGDFLQPI